MGRVANQPTLVGYLHYATGGVERFRDAEKATQAYELSAEWATMGGNHLGAQRVKHLIVDLKADCAGPAEAIKIHIRHLAELPPHGAAFYAWSTMRALLSPLAEIARDEVVAVIAGALRASPIKLDKGARAALCAVKARRSDVEFETWSARGTAMDLSQARSYVEHELDGPI